MNWINSWNKRNKKNKFIIQIRLGYLTLLEIDFCGDKCDESCRNKRLRFMILNFGFEL
jgi:hypothetical protein